MIENSKIEWTDQLSVANNLGEFELVARLVHDETDIALVASCVAKPLHIPVSPRVIRGMSKWQWNAHLCTVFLDSFECLNSFANDLLNLFRTELFSGHGCLPAIDEGILA